MKKSHLKKLTLSRETLRELTSPGLSEALGGAKPQETRATSICYPCPTQAEGCPNPMDTIG
jgi:hypothetical protein